MKIMGELLGISRDELLQGYEDGVYWPETTPRFDYVQQAIDEVAKR